MDRHAFLSAVPFMVPTSLSSWPRRSDRKLEVLLRPGMASLSIEPRQSKPAFFATTTTTAATTTRRSTTTSTSTTGEAPAAANDGEVSIPKRTETFDEDDPALSSFELAIECVERTSVNDEDEDEHTTAQLEQNSNCSKNIMNNSVRKDQRQRILFSSSASPQSPPSSLIVNDVSIFVRIEGRIYLMDINQLERIHLEGDKPRQQYHAAQREQLQKNNHNNSSSNNSKSNKKHQRQQKQNHQRKQQQPGENDSTSTVGNVATIPESLLLMFDSCFFRVFCTAAGLDHDKDMLSMLHVELEQLLNSFHPNSGDVYGGRRCFSFPDEHWVITTPPKEHHNSSSNTTTSSSTEQHGQKLRTDEEEAEAERQRCLKRQRINENDEEEENHDNEDDLREMMQSQMTSVARLQRRHVTLEDCQESLDAVMELLDTPVSSIDPNTAASTIPTALGALMTAAAEKRGQSYCTAHDKDVALEYWSSKLRDNRSQLEETLNTFFPPPRTRTRPSNSSTSSESGSKASTTTSNGVGTGNVSEENIERLLEQHKQALAERHRILLLPTRGSNK